MMCSFHIFSLFSLFMIVFSACPNGTIQGLTPDVCYLFSNSKDNIQDAELECISYGGHLVSIESAFENSFLQKHAAQLFGRDENFYTGGQVDESLTWWIDGSMSTYLNWATGYTPDPNGGVIYMDVKTGSWYTQDVESEDLSYYFVCRVPSGKPNCDEDEIFYQLSNKCYSIPEAENFSDDQKWCQSKNRNLVSIHSDLEQNVVATYSTVYSQIFFQVGTFIGLHKPADSWEWLDGSSFNYTNWVGGAAPKTSTYCVYMAFSNSSWIGDDQAHCDVLPDITLDYGGICQKDVKISFVENVFEMKQSKNLGKKKKMIVDKI